MAVRFDRRVVALVLIALLVVGLAVGGCTAKKPREDTAQRSEELTPGEFPETNPPAAKTPPPPMLRNPKTSVYSYLLWISYAYRILNSDVATMAFSPYEEVRVNSYVELNRQEGKAIDQRLIDFTVKNVRTKGDTSTVGVRESWRYRYIDIKSGKYNSPPYEVTYDTTYTVVNYDDKGWLVDKVQAAPEGGQPK